MSASAHEPDGRARRRATLDSGGGEARPTRNGHGNGNGRVACFLIRNRDCLGLLRAREIDWMRAEGNYTCIHAGRTEHLVRRGIGEMESQLDHGRFLRISRSVIVNLDRVDRLVHGSVGATSCVSPRAWSSSSPGATRTASST